VAALELLANVVVSGLLVGGLYAAVAIGFGLALGFVGVANLAHPAIVVAGAYAALVAWREGLDPLLAALLFAPLFFAAGYALQGFYARAFERQGGSALNGMTFFFGLMFVVEVLLLLAYGSDYQIVTPAYGSTVLRLGPVDLPMRLLVPFIAGCGMTLLLALYLRRSFTGRAIAAVAQDPLGLAVLGADPEKMRRIAFGISLATCAVAGALVLITLPVHPASGREFIGRIFAVVVLVE
jgi:branched-chain amino acid transport system permease protein